MIHERTAEALILNKNSTFNYYRVLALLNAKTSLIETDSQIELKEPLSSLTREVLTPEKSLTSSW